MAKWPGQPRNPWPSEPGRPTHAENDYDRPKLPSRTPTDEKKDLPYDPPRRPPKDDREK
jgi:hypothetical protein